MIIVIAFHGSGYRTFNTNSLNWGYRLCNHEGAEFGTSVIWYQRLTHPKVAGICLPTLLFHPYIATAISLRTFL